MKQLHSKRKYKCPATIIAFISNVILLLVVPPNDLGDWFFKIVESLAVIKILITSWKWRSLNVTAIIPFLNATQVNKQTLR